MGKYVCGAYAAKPARQRPTSDRRQTSIPKCGVTVQDVPVDAQRRQVGQHPPTKSERAHGCVGIEVCPCTGSPHQGCYSQGPEDTGQRCEEQHGVEGPTGRRGLRSPGPRHDADVCWVEQRACACGDTRVSAVVKEEVGRAVHDVSRADRQAQQSSSRIAGGRRPSGDRAVQHLSCVKKIVVGCMSTSRTKRPNITKALHPNLLERISKKLNNGNAARFAMASRATRNATRGELAKRKKTLFTQLQQYVGGILDVLTRYTGRHQNFPGTSEMIPGTNAVINSLSPLSVHASRTIIKYNDAWLVTTYLFDRDSAHATVVRKKKMGRWNYRSTTVMTLHARATSGKYGRLYLTSDVYRNSGVPYTTVRSVLDSLGIYN